MSCNWYVDERIRLILGEKATGSEEYERELAFIEGMLEGMERYGHALTQQDVVDSWKALSYHVASREGIVAYFLLKNVIDSNPEALMNYKQDFYQHDFHAIRRRRNASFFWLLRPLGTHLVWADDEKLDETLAFWVLTWGYDACFFGYYDAETQTLRELNLRDYKGDAKALVGLLC